MSTTRNRAGGLRLANEYELWDFDAQNDVGGMAGQSLFHMLAELLWNTSDDLPQTGFVGGACEVTNGAGPLDVDIAAGLGFYYDAAETDEFRWHYKPIVVDAVLTDTLAAHDATNPRIDIVVIRPTLVNDQTATRSIWDTAMSSASTQSVETRRRLTYQQQVVTGTPSATPSAPVVPTGYLLLAEVAVPAVAGAAVIRDMRPLLQLGQSWLQALPAGFSRSHVIANSYAAVQGELNVTADGSSLVLAVAGGETSYYGYRYRYQPSTVTCVPDATLPRYATVYAKDDGTVNIAHGTAAINPTPPTFIAGLGQYPLFNVYLAAAATAVTGGDLADLRNGVGGHIDTDQLATDAVDTSKLADAAVDTSKLADAAVTPDKLGFVTLVPELTIGTISSGFLPIDIVAKDLNGQVVPNAKVLVELWESNGDTVTTADIVIDQTGTGAELTDVWVSGNPHARILLQTDVNGQDQISVVEYMRVGAYSMYVSFEAVNYIGARKVVKVNFT